MGRIQFNEWPTYAPADAAKKENVLIVARLMVNAALTAPITGGVPGNEAEIAFGEKEIEAIAREMERLAYQEVPGKLKRPFLYEAAMVRESDAVVFLGNWRAHSTPLDAGCGLCGGEPNCSFLYDRVSHTDGLIDTTDRSRKKAVKGPVCMIRSMDLGFAVGSALWIAADNFVDARAFYSVGLAGRNLDFCPNSEIVVGIPLAVMAKNPFADISSDYHLHVLAKQVDAVRKTSVIARQLAQVVYQTHDPAQKPDKED